MHRIKDVLFKADKSLFLKISNLRIGYLNRFFCVFTNIGGVFFQIFLIIHLTLLPSTRQTGLRLGLIQIIVTAVVQLFKFLVDRVRPYDALVDVIPLKVERDKSFPSGHTAAAFSSAIAISNVIPSANVLFLMIAALIGYSRIYLGVHYPSDVVAGGLIGIALTKALL